MTRKTKTEPMLRGHAAHRRTQGDYMGALLDRVAAQCITTELPEHIEP